MKPIYISYLNGLDIAELAVRDDEILDAVEIGLTSQGRGETVIEPRVHLVPIVVDDWGQCRTGQFGALRAHVEAGKLSEATLHAELCQIVTGARPGRERPGETILFWHRGLSLSDIALGHAMLEKARRLGIGQQLRYA